MLSHHVKQIQFQQSDYIRENMQIDPRNLGFAKCDTESFTWAQPQPLTDHNLPTDFKSENPFQFLWDSWPAGWWEIISNDFSFQPLSFSMICSKAMKTGAGQLEKDLFSQLGWTFGEMRHVIALSVFSFKWSLQWWAAVLPSGWGFHSFLGSGKRRRPIQIGPESTHDLEE